MKRDPDVATVFTGVEVEGTSALGLETTFVSGFHPISTYENVTTPHVYLAANQSFAAAEVNEWLDLLLALAGKFPARKFSIDVPAAYAEKFLTTALPENVIVQICLRIPSSNLSNVYLKLDDDIRNTVNKGVWVSPIKAIMAGSKFTPWSAYNNDSCE